MSAAEPYRYVDDPHPFWRTPGLRAGDFVLVVFETGLKMTGYVVRSLVEEPRGYLGLAVHEYGEIGNDHVCFGWWVTIPEANILFIHRLLERRPEGCRCSMARVLNPDARGQES